MSLHYKRTQQYLKNNFWKAYTSGLAGKLSEVTLGSLIAARWLYLTHRLIEGLESDFSWATVACKMHGVVFMRCCLLTLFCNWHLQQRLRGNK